MNTYEQEALALQTQIEALEPLCEMGHESPTPQAEASRAALTALVWQQFRLNIKAGRYRV